MDAISSSVVTSIGHGYTEQLIKLGLKPELIPCSDARVCFEVALDLYRAHKPISKLAVLLGASGKLTDPAEIKFLFSLNGTGDVDPKDVVRQAGDQNLRQLSSRIFQKYTQLVSTKPDEIAHWLPVMAQQLQSLAMSSTHVYDPRPSAHKGDVVAPVMFRSAISTYNKMFAGNAGDGGGYRAGWWRVWIGISGKGKTTTAYTIGCDAVRQYKRVVYVSKELQNTIRGRLMMGLTHLTMDEINKETAAEMPVSLLPNGEVPMVVDSNGKTIGPWHEKSTRQYLMDAWGNALDQFVSVYPWSYFSQDSARQFIAWHDPSIIFFDFIDETDSTDTKSIPGGLGRISAACAQIAHESRISMESFWQMSGSETAAYLKNRRHIVKGPFGSTAVVHAADEVYQTRRADQPGQQHYLRTKSRAGGDTEEYFLKFDPNSWVYVEPPGPHYG